MSTQDSLFLLRRILRKHRKMQPHIIVAVDLRKAFDTASHEAIITTMKVAYPGKRMLNFIKSFLHHRTFEVRTGRPNPKTYTNDIGVPQGSVISPVLFNVVMRSIATALEEESTIHFVLRR